MKRIVAAVAILLTVAGFTVKLDSGQSVAADTTSTVSTFEEKACPSFPVKIVSVDVTPREPAAQHLITLRWESQAPQCYAIEKTAIKGRLIFGNGHKTTIATQIIGSQSSVEIRVPGQILSAVHTNSSRAPTSIEVGITLEASALVAGGASTAGEITPGQGDLPVPITCLPQVIIRDVQASFLGLTLGTPRFPMVGVRWTPKPLPTCYALRNFNVSVLLPQERLSSSVEAPPTAHRASVTFSSLSVPSDYVPSAILATVKTTGKAVISSHVSQTTPLN